MKIKRLFAQNCVKEIEEIIKAQEEICVYGIPDKCYVIRGDSNLISLKECYSNSIGILRIPNKGGVIVVSEGDLEIGHFSKDLYNTFASDFMEYLLAFLNEKFGNFLLVGNDILYKEKYKCASYTTTRINNILYSAVHISINLNAELIDKICIKEKKKIPFGLSILGISTEDILELFKDFFQE